MSKLISVANKALAFRAEQEEALGPTSHLTSILSLTHTHSLLVLVFVFCCLIISKLTHIIGHSGGCSHAQAKKLGDVTSLNLTVLKAGVSSDGGNSFAMNVIPTEAKAGFDIRITPHTKPAEIKEMIDKWCEEAGSGVTWTWGDQGNGLTQHYATSIDVNIHLTI